MNTPKDRTRQKIQRFAQIARDLRAGESFNITRLTTIKSLAKEPKSANRFVLYVAEKANEVIQKSGGPEGMQKADWKQGQKLAAEAIEQMTKFIKRRSKGREKTLRELRRQIQDLQNEHKKIKWGSVRIVSSRELLIVEKALQCCTSSHVCDHWAYQVASDFAERYSTKYGTGLIPASAPMVEDIAEFWCQELLGKGLQEAFADQEG